jgi:hypothetical protein
VKVEFLCDDETIRDSDGRRRSVVPLAGCRTLTAANLDGTRFVAFDTRTRTVTAPLIDGTEATVEIEHACLEAYLLAKLSPPVTAATRRTTATSSSPPMMRPVPADTPDRAALPIPSSTSVPNGSTHVRPSESSSAQCATHRRREQEPAWHRSAPHGRPCLTRSTDPE